VFDGLKKTLQGVKEKFNSEIIDNEESDKLENILTREEPVENHGFVEKVKVFITDREFIISSEALNEPLSELEFALLESDVALSVTEEISGHIKKDLTGKRRKIGEPVDKIIEESLRSALLQVLGEGINFPEFIRSKKKPVKMLFTGVNGTGKTTTIAKVGNYLKKNGFSVVIGAGDTYRAGAIDQIDIHAERLGIKVIEHQEGADPSAVLFDTVQYAESHGIDVVLADTAGRFHNKVNLMNQLSKMKRVMKPDMVIYVDEAVAGNDAVTRSDEFQRSIGIDAIILTKADMDSRGGAAISIAHTLGKPLIFLGSGQGYDDLMPFIPEKIVNDLLGESPNA